MITNRRTYHQEAKLLGKPTDFDSNQGTGVAISRNGKVLVTVGIFDNGGDSGAAWVFRYCNGAWQQVQKIVPPNTDDAFLSSAAISDDGRFIFLGGPFDGFFEGASEIGAIWVYGEEGGQWDLLQKIVPPAGSQAQSFGTNIAWTEDIFVTGSPFDFGPNAVAIGSAYVYRYDRCEKMWKFEQKLMSANAEGPAQQGYSTAISRNGQVIAVGAAFDGSIFSPTGAAFVWRFDDPTKLWREEATLIGSIQGSSQGEESGYSVAVSACGDLITTGGIDFGSGSSWVFEAQICHDRSCPRKWEQIAQLVGYPLNYDQGSSTAMTDDGSYIFIGAPGILPTSVGGVMVFHRVNRKKWVQESFITPNDGIPPSAVGFGSSSLSISKDGKVVAVGGPLDNGGQGATWVFRAS